MKHLLLATLLVSPLALHAQLIGLSSSYSISVVGHESDPSAYQPPSLSLSGTGDGSYSSSDINTTGWELTGAQAAFSAGIGGSLYSHHQSAPVYILTDSLDLGVLQPNAVYTFTASAHADARTFTSDSYGHTEALVDFAGGIDVTPVPEPGTYAFATGAGLLGFVFWRQAKARRLSPNN